MRWRSISIRVSINIASFWLNYLVNRYRQDFEAEKGELEKKEDSETSQLFEQVIQAERELAARYDETLAGSSEQVFRASQAETELSEWRRQYEADCRKLEDELLASKEKEKSILKSQLAARRKRRERELLEAGMHAKDAEKIAVDEMAEEEERVVKQFQEGVEEEREKLMTQLQAVGEEKEKEIIRARCNEATQAAMDADLERLAAQQKLEALRIQQREEVKKLDEAMAASRKNNESKLKTRLAEKRAAALKDLAQQRSSDEEKQRLLKKLEEEEHQSMLELLGRREEEEELARLEQKRNHEELLLAVEKDARKKELEASVQAAREASLLSLKDAQNRSEDEKNTKNLQKLRDQHAKEEDRLFEAAKMQKAQGQGKLADRLAQKRAQKEKDLTDKAQKALADLDAKQAAEAEERAAKMVWTDRLQECMLKATSLGLKDAEFEDFCLQNIVARNVVPQRNMYEAIERILNPRHSSAMSVLLKKNFNERIDALRLAVQTVLDEKALNRVRLLESMVAAGISEGEVQQSLRALDEEYATMQLLVEGDVTRSLEPLHMEQQITMRQQQLLDVSSLVGLYSDPDSLGKLQESSKSQAEELEAYRQLVESEKKLREEKLAVERKEIEERLRQQHDSQVQQMQEELQRDMAKTEASYEAEKKALLERKEQMEREAADEKGVLDIKEKERILSEFEKEHQASLAALEKEKSTQKRKLQDRLAAKRQIKASKSAVVPPPATEPTEKPANKIVDIWNKLSQRRGSAVNLASSTRRNSITILGQNLKDAVTAVTAPLSQSSSATTNPALNASIAQIESKLERIEKVIEAIAKNHSSEGLRVSQPPLDSVNAHYTDDNEPQSGDALTPVGDESLELVAQEVTRLIFGRRLAALVGLKGMSIRAAHSLPPPQVSNNAFACSYLFHQASTTLFVHKERLSSSGDFGLLLMHAFSHIKVEILVFICRSIF
jgi:hypothetical protein